MTLSIEQLNKLYPFAKEGHIEAFLSQYPALFERFGIGANANRYEFFMAQISHESAGLSLVEENLNYSTPSRLVEIWPKHFPTEKHTKPYIHNPKNLANKVYAKRLGNIDPDDGWNFRGRGYIQITGRQTYQLIGQKSELNLLTNPHLAASPQYALLVACTYWHWKNINLLCDTGDYASVTKRINGGTHGMDSRENWLAFVRKTGIKP